MTRHLPLAISTLALGLCTSLGAWSRWGTDPQTNLPIANVANAAQVQPQIVATPDDHWWISWFTRLPHSAPPVGYDVYLQRLSANGTKLLAPQGVEVARLGVGWTEDYGLTTDGLGHALLAFQDDRADPASRRITVTRHDPRGEPLWGTQGLPMSSDTGHSPRIAALPQGHTVVGWSSETDVHLQKINALGGPLWGRTATSAQDLILGEPNYHYSLADLQPAGDGSTIVSFVRSRGFSSDRHLYANKISRDGQLLWGASHVKVFDGGSLQQGNFPRFVPDGRGGAVFAWYSVSPHLQVSAQHILANGQPAFAHNGVPVSTDLRQARVEPAFSYQESTGEITLFWSELDSAQAQNRRGLYAQKIDARGQRQWGETGRIIRPLAHENVTDLNSVALADGTLAFWVQDFSGQARNSIQAIKLDTQGNTLCAQFAVSNRPTEKSRLTAKTARTGQTLLAWEEHSQGSAIYAQSISPDCKLG